MAEPIRVRISPVRYGPSVSAEARTSFWASLRETERHSNQSIEEFEATLTHQFGPALRNRLIQAVREEVSEFEKGLFGVEFSAEIWRFLDHELHFMRHEKGWPSAWSDPIVKYFDLRQHALTEVPKFRASLDRLAAAAAVRFSTRIRGYGSLDLELLVGSAERLSEVFDENFDAFRVFLDCFIPLAFADVFTSEFAGQMRYEVSPPTALQKAFRKKPSQPVKQPSTATADEPHSAAATPHREALRKAEWIWRLANGSLLVPLILALIVLYFGLRELSSLRTTQYDALKPILEHQMQLLREDRERMAADHVAAMHGRISPASQPSP
ncbi:MAG: hypothetical protein HS102_11115 [Planctomycetia bacterium]|nr:hypothetical protein [Planctomycetia bacterium]